MTSHEFDRVSFFGVGIPEEPDEDNIKPVLASLHIGAKVKWKTFPDVPPQATFVDAMRWSDGYQPRFYVVKNRTL